MNGIIGFTDLLLADEALPAGHRRHAERIQEAGTVLLTVINDVLDFSKIEAGHVDLAPASFAIERLVDHSVAMMRPFADAKSLKLKVLFDDNLSRFYLGDEVRMRQILLNLLNNAVKFTGKGSIAVSVAKMGLSEGRDRVRFAVTDTGIGINSEASARLFRPFKQGDSSIERRFGGTGLGLAIAKKLVDLMGGEIGFYSEVGQGTTFWFELPLAASEPPHQRVSSGRQAPSVRGTRILLAEDLPLNQELARAMLASLGCKVDVAGDGATAAVAAASGEYDVILMDIHMPVMNGIAATQAIRALPGAPGRVPIVALTANVLADQVDQYRRAGMAHHLAKPIRQRQLHSVLAAALAGRPDAGTTAAAPKAQIFDARQFQRVQGMIPDRRLRTHVAALERQMTGLLAGDLVANDLEQGAHKAASQAAMLGLNRLAEAMRALESACRANSDTTSQMRDCQRAVGDLRHLRTGTDG